jgi:hypothetical protein
MSESNLLMRTEGYALDRELGTRPSTKKTMDSTFMGSGGIAMNTTGLSAKEEDAIGREFVKVNSHEEIVLPSSFIKDSASGLCRS